MHGLVWAVFIIATSALRSLVGHRVLSMGKSPLRIASPTARREAMHPCYLVSYSWITVSETVASSQTGMKTATFEFLANDRIHMHGRLIDNE